GFRVGSLAWLLFVWGFFRSSFRVIPSAWLLGAVVVEAAAALSAESARHHHALQEGGRGITGLAEFLEHDLGHEHGGVEPDEIEKGERPHGIAAAELHGLVDVFAGGEPALVDA